MIGSDGPKPLDRSEASRITNEDTVESNKSESVRAVTTSYRQIDGIYLGGRSNLTGDVVRNPRKNDSAVEQMCDIAEVRVILCDEWTPAQVKAFRVVVKRSVSWADWDDELFEEFYGKGCVRRFAR
jgi:hypothetical protein